MFYHFGCQDIKDFGWGCAYRCIQSLCSYLRLHMGYIARNERFIEAEPRHSDIQQVRYSDGFVSFFFLERLTTCHWLRSLNRNLLVLQILIDNEDKPASFLGSREWIGSFEVCLVLDTLYDVSSDDGPALFPI